MGIGVRVDPIISPTRSWESPDLYLLLVFGVSNNCCRFCVTDLFLLELFSLSKFITCACRVFVSLKNRNVVQSGNRQELPRLSDRI